MKRDSGLDEKRNSVIVVDVRHLAVQSRTLIPDRIESSITPPASTSWKQKTIPVPQYETSYDECSGLASHITADLNVPDFLVGPQFEQCSSIRFVGCAALELVRIELARAGLPKYELDKLTTAHVSLRKVSIPFMLRFLNDDEAQRNRPTPKRKKDAPPEHGGFGATSILSEAGHAIFKFAAAMNEYASLLRIERNALTQDFADHEQSVLAMHTSEYQGCHHDGQENGVSLIFDYRPAKEMVRLNINLDEHYLHSQGWQALESWHKVKDERYKSIFDHALRSILWLDEQEWQLNETNPGHLYDAFKSRYLLCDLLQVKELLRDYFADVDLIDSSVRLADFTGLRNLHTGIPEMGEAAIHEFNWKKRLRQYRMHIRTWTQIDIGQPWIKEKARLSRKQRKLQSLLRARLGYPGDFHPEAEQEQSYFCEENMPWLRDWLRQQYDNAAATE